jgi:hypothetical protein
VNIAQAIKTLDAHIQCAAYRLELECREEDRQIDAELGMDTADSRLARIEEFWRRCR